MANRIKPRLNIKCGGCGGVFQTLNPQRTFCSHRCSNNDGRNSNPKSPLALLESKFVRGDKLQCWEWLGGLYKNGYGRFSSKLLKEMYAHRAAYRLYVGEIPLGQMVLHKCDNPSCVNPNHLFVGTAQDNMDDMWAKGRAKPRKGLVNGIAKMVKDNPTLLVGEGNGNAKLDIKAVVEIRKLYKRLSYKSSNSRELAKRFGVTINCILQAVKGKRWSHV